MDFNNTDLKENGLLITNDDGSFSFIPIEDSTIEDQALFAEFRAEYPYGKPEPIVEPVQLQPTIEDYLVDLDFRLSKIELGV